MTNSDVAKKSIFAVEGCVVSWQYLKYILVETEETLIKLGAVISVGLLIYEMLYHKFTAINQPPTRKHTKR